MQKTGFAVEKRTAVPNRVNVYSPQGTLNGHQECFDWLESIRSDIQSGAKFVVINLKNVSRVDSTGVGIIASIHVSAVNAGGKLCLTELGPRERALFESTWLLRVIPNFDDEAAAIAACA
jgi:anti-sigma B factor antagonist